MFDFRLKVFNTVARRLNFTKASLELNISQPAVTKHIKEIEHALHLQLFERNGTKIKLTKAGEVLNLRNFELEGMSLRIQQLNVEAGLLTLQAETLHRLFLTA